MKKEIKKGRGMQVSHACQARMSVQKGRPWNPGRAAVGMHFDECAFGKRDVSRHVVTETSKQMQRIRLSRHLYCSITKESLGQALNNAQSPKCWTILQQWFLIQDLSPFCNPSTLKVDVIIPFSLKK
eukprot:532356-Pelagomonas_calceolata.AAC.2